MLRGIYMKSLLVLLVGTVFAFAGEVNNGKVAKNAKTLKLTEDLRIGGDQGEEYIWFGTGLDVAVNSTGQIFVCDTGNTRLAMLDENGTFVRNVGGQGTGPGEFQTLSGIQILNDDRVVTFEFNPMAPFSKFHFFDAEGTYVESKQTPFGVIFQQALMAFDGSSVAGTYVTFDMETQRMKIITGILNEAFEPLYTVAEFERSMPNPQRFVEGAYWSEYLGENIKSARSLGAVAYSPDGQVYTAKLAKYSIKVFNKTFDQPVLTIHKDYTPIPNPEEEILAVVEPIRDAIVGSLPQQISSIVTDQVVLKALELAEIPPIKQPVFGIVPVPGVGFAVMHDISFVKNTQTLDLFNPAGKYLGSYTIDGVTSDSLAVFLRFYGNHIYRFESSDEAGEPDLVRYAYELIDAQ